jgi:hypothetical protein
MNEQQSESLLNEVLGTIQHSKESKDEQCPSVPLITPSKPFLFER